MGDVEGWKMALQGLSVHPTPQIPSAAPPAPAPKREFVVLVTGFGPFPGAPQNTSHLLTQHLPSHLSILHKYNPTSLPIRILNPTSAPGKYVKAEYAYVRKYIQDLYDQYQEEVDAIVHLGMAEPWEWYSVEERAFNERFTSNWWEAREEEGYYLVPDAEGKTVKDINKEQGKGRWDDMPLGLKAAGVNVKVVVDDVRKVVNYQTEEERGNGEEKERVEVISHDEAGNYLCGFVFYESLATVRRRGLNTRVLFCHVPGWKDRKRLKRGADFVCAVVGAVCRQINPASPEQIMYPR